MTDPEKETFLILTGRWEKFGNGWRTADRKFIYDLDEAYNFEIDQSVPGRVKLMREWMKLIPTPDPEEKFIPHTAESHKKYLELGDEYYLKAEY